VDLDNSGLLSKLVIIHKAYGNNDGRPGGATIYRKLPDGSYTAVTPTQSGIQLNGTSSSEFYSDNPDLPLVAVATAQPTSASVGEPVSFDGSQSSDPDGSIVQHLWSFGDGAGATGAAVSHSYQSAGTFVATLTVTDDDGAASMATVTIAVTDTTPPTVAISSGAFTPTVSADVIRVDWFFDGGLAATTTTPPFSYTLNLSPGPGSHTLHARAHDGAGNATDSGPLTLQQ